MTQELTSEITIHNNRHLPDGSSETTLRNAAEPSSSSLTNVSDVPNVMSVNYTDKADNDLACKHSETNSDDGRACSIFPGSNADHFADGLSHDNLHKSFSTRVCDDSFMSTSENVNSESVPIVRGGHNKDWHVSNVVAMCNKYQDLVEFRLPDEIFQLDSQNVMGVTLSSEMHPEQSESLRSTVTFADENSNDFSNFAVPEDILTSDSEYIVSQFEELLDDGYPLNFSE